jgi:hypothetical protein
MSRPNDIRQEILFQAYALRPIAISAPTVHRECRKRRIDYSELEITRELPFLVGEKLLTAVRVPGITEKSFEITSEGIRHYEENFG